MSQPAPILRLERFRELWVHTGTACNLSCPFCHEGSEPGDKRLGAPTLEALAPHLDAAAAQGIERFAFTGGEPLIHRGMLEILLYALRLRPATVLTNGTAPFIRRTHHLALLREAPHPLTLRVSIDHADEARHDAGRGLKNFRKALEGLRLLHAAGFAVGITRQITPGEDAAKVAAQFRQLLRKQHLPEDLPVVALPELGSLFDQAKRAAAAGEACAPLHGMPASGPYERAAPGCTRSRMLLVRDETLRFQACPLTDDAPRFETGRSLPESLAAQVVPDHPRCTACLGPGVDYIGAACSPAPTPHVLPGVQSTLL